MFKKLVTLVVVLVILSVASTSQAVIGQDQGFSIGAFLDVLRCGPGNATDSINTTIDQQQQAADLTSNSLGLQNETAILVGSGTAVGICGMGSVDLNVGTGGCQEQLVTPNATAQEQGVGAGIGLAVSNFGLGSAVGSAGLVENQTQVASSPTSTAIQNNFLGVTSFASASGNAKVDNSVIVCAEQSQGTVADCPVNICWPKPPCNKPGGPCK